MGRNSTFHHYAPLFPTKRENGQRKKDKIGKLSGVYGPIPF
jgi:hypothetical protein